jgi:putative ATP-dependent endonuclease of OLD family
MDGSNTGTCTFYFRPKKEVRRNLYEVSGQPEQVEERITRLTIDDYEPFVTGRATGDCLDDATYAAWAGDLENFSFPDPEDDDQNLLGVKAQFLYQEVACTFVRALRDVVSELRGYRNNPLLALLRGMESHIEIADAEKIAVAIKTLNTDISSLKEIKGLANRVEDAIQKAVGHTYGPGVSIESQLPDAMDKLLQKLCLLVGGGGGADYRGELHEQSLGDANLIYLALKLLEYEIKLSSDRVAHFFLIEEPEAHIHTHIQKTLFSNLPTAKTQVIVSTHSTQISSAARVASVNVLAKFGDYAEVYQPARGLTPDVTKRLERYLDAVRSTLLFAKGVLLVEGDAEQIMIPAMLRAVFGTSPDEIGFSVISMSSAFFEHVAVVFADSRIRRSCAIVTDLDRAVIELPSDVANDSPEQAKARTAQKVGASRQEALEAFCGGNDFVQPFFAERTFEVDFLLSNNRQEVEAALDEIYATPGPKAASKARLADRDAKVAGKEILRIANKCGKGWFALLLSEKLSCETFVPEYILRAIAFACRGSINDKSLKRIGEFRGRCAPAPYTLEGLMPLAVLQPLTPSDFLRLYRESAPDDSLSLFCDYLDEFRDQ